MNKLLLLVSLSLSALITVNATAESGSHLLLEHVTSEARIIKEKELILESFHACTPIEQARVFVGALVQHACDQEKIRNLEKEKQELKDALAKKNEQK